MNGYSNRNPNSQLGRTNVDENMKPKKQSTKIGTKAVSIRRLPNLDDGGGRFGKPKHCISVFEARKTMGSLANLSIRICWRVMYDVDGTMIESMGVDQRLIDQAKGIAADLGIPYMEIINEGRVCE